MRYVFKITELEDAGCTVTLEDSPGYHDQFGNWVSGISEAHVHFPCGDAHYFMRDGDKLYIQTGSFNLSGGPVLRLAKQHGVNYVHDL